MLQNLFKNMGDVTKNLLIINVLFFVAKVGLEARGIDLGQMLGMHYLSSPYFEPYQIATHFFMHANIGHIFFNMFALVMMGSHLERYWGAKRYLIFYFVTAFGAALLHFGVQGIEIYNATGEFFPKSSILDVDFKTGQFSYDPSVKGSLFIANMYLGTVVGASGAIYGLLMAFAMLFPNTQFMLLFPPIPIKAKWMALGLGLYALYSGYANNPGDSTAHFAHLGGMLFGFILIKIWKKSRNQFY